MFNQIDTDGSGEIDFDEFHTVYRNMHDRSNKISNVWTQIADVAVDEKCLELATIFALPTGCRTVQERRKAKDFMQQTLGPLIRANDKKWYHDCANLMLKNACGYRFDSIVEFLCSGVKLYSAGMDQVCMTCDMNCEIMCR